MLKKIENLPDGVIGLFAIGKVTGNDYEHVLIPLLEEARKKGQKIRMLYCFGPEFDSFSPKAIWDDFSMSLKFMRLFERCALVSDVDWIRNATKFVGSLFFPVRIFHNAGMQDAIAWLDPAMRDENIEYELLYEKGILVIEPKGALEESFFSSIRKTVDPWIEKNGRLNGIIVKAKKFPGWENLAGLIQHLKFVKDHHRKVNRIALVTESGALAKASEFTKHFVAAEVKHFAYNQFDQAMDWIESSPSYHTLV